MTKKSNKRYLKELEGRKMKKALFQLESLAAAYMLECNIRASEARLVVEELQPDEVKKQGAIVKYHYEHFDRDAFYNHPDVKALVNYSLLLVQARRENKQDDINAIIDELASSMEKYDDSEADQVAGKAGLSDQERNEDRRS